jgi:hypothetical protein
MPYVRQATEFPVIYAYGPDSSPQSGVPSGVIHEHAWNESSIFPGTTRRYWVYVPATYMPSEPVPLMVFQDGWLYLNPDGAYRRWWPRPCADRAEANQAVARLHASSEPRHKLERAERQHARRRPTRCSGFGRRWIRLPPRSRRRKPQPGSREPRCDDPARCPPLALDEPRVKVTRRRPLTMA